MQAEGLWQIETDEPFYSNRYHHCANSSTWILTGSQPVIRFGKRRAVLGSFRFFNGEGTPLDGRKGVKFRFRSGESGWDTPDASILTGAPENLHAVIVRIRCEKPVTVQYGGVHLCDCGWNVCPDFDGNYRTVAFDESQLGESYTPVSGGFLVEREEVDGFLTLHTGKKWRLYLTADFPLRIENGRAVGECVGEGLIGAFLCEGDEKPMNLAEAFSSMEARADRLCARLQVSSPNEALNAACAFAANYQDGIWYPPKHMHAETTWSDPMIGWTNRYGSAVLGWHDRVLEELKYYSDKQIAESENRGMPEPEPGQAFTLPPQNSAFYGRGRIAEDQHMYGMQSVYFDQAIHSWRMTGDREMAKTLRPMLELHCDWLDACFERDASGTYESVIDSWPTDSVWSDGGATPEETAYAFRAHEAARDLALLDGDAEAAERHGAKADLIRGNFTRLLWSEKNGVPGKCREQGGYGRLLDSPWSYSIFLPVDAGLLDEFQNAQALYYTKWAYQNDPTPNGRIVWHSNWVPMIWSTRPGGGLEQYMLAYAFFKAGLPEDGMALMNGMLDQPSKQYSDGSHISSSGSLQSDGSRAVLEGIFGYHPDYPMGKVAFTPAFPFDWRDASVSTPDVWFAYHRENGAVTVKFELARPAPVDVTAEVFLYADELTGMEGAESVELLPGFGRTRAVLHFGRCHAGQAVLRIGNEREPVLPREIAADPLGKAFLPCTGAPESLIDPQGAAASFEICENGIEITASNVSGRKWLCAKIGGKAPRYEIFHLNLGETAEEAERKERMHPAMDGVSGFRTVDLTPALGGDIRQIYRQKYLSPRPLTVSARIGTDGYSPWTFAYWHNEAPEITLSETGVRKTADGVPLTVSDGDRNIAFVSLWDNYPDSVTVPVNGSAKAAVLLLCGTTNPMQCGVENVRLTFRYESGAEEALSLRNPTEFWSLCPLYAMPSSADQVRATSSDYDYEKSAFCLPEVPPETLQLGENCRAVVIRWKLREGDRLRSVTLSAISKEVVAGLMALTLAE